MTEADHESSQLPSSEAELGSLTEADESSQHNEPPSEAELGSLTEENPELFKPYDDNIFHRVLI